MYRAVDSPPLTEYQQLREMFPRTMCGVCASVRCADVERWLRRGLSLRCIARRSGLPRGAIRQHRAHLRGT
jgi:hypothetical protein